MPGRYIEVSIAADADLLENLAGVLSQLGFEGFWEDGSVLKCYMPVDQWREPMLDEVRRVTSLMTRSSTSTAPVIEVRQLEDQNWNAQWEKTVKPIKVTDRIVITPTWQQYTEHENEIVLTIDPKMSFGTGYHESTRLSLRMLERHLRPGMNVLDIGTGTGVLAIAAVRLGAVSAVALDNDDWSYNNALENTRLNSVEKYVKVILGDLHNQPVTVFNLIIANIQRTVIQSLLPSMKERLARGGLMLLSGLLDTDREEMQRSLLGAGFEVVNELAENEWIALAVHHSSP